MARQESDRDDLFAELAALSPRVELVRRDLPSPVCAGRKESTGGWSIYLGPDKVYHFDASGGLRRAYVDGFLYRSEGVTLARLRRERSPTETSLLRTDLEPSQVDQFVTNMRAALAKLQQQIIDNQLVVSRVMPPETDALAMLAAALCPILAATPPLSPIIRG